MTTATPDPYAWPTDTALTTATDTLARVRALMEKHARKDGRVPIGQLRAALRDTQDGAQ